ncbi:MAG TPA: NAD(P)/FAD-dependent oxidoreductase [Candidatus Cryosericum sp.]|nr:NAD(P)/FAD-dependent oxidoreductase [Candidatus Cryosericum sp.]
MSDVTQQRESLDVVVIGAGVVGCAAARELSRYRLSVAVCEQGAEAGQGGATKANTGIIHAGYDPAPGTLMARMNVRGNALYTDLCHDLGVRLERAGTLVVALSQEDRPYLDALLARGRANGVPGLCLVGHDELMKLEPNVNHQADSALFAPTGGTVEPYEVALALAENAARNGVWFLFDCAVSGLEPADDGWCVHVGAQELRTRFVVNAAGLSAAKISQSAVPGKRFHMHPRLGQYVLLENRPEYDIRHPVFQVPGPTGKGVVVSRTPDGNIIVGPTAEDTDSDRDLATTGEGLRSALAQARRSVPTLDERLAITEFCGARAIIDERDDFLIEESAPGFFNAAGIKSPGLTAAPAIAEELIRLMANSGLKLVANPAFVPTNEPGRLFRDCSAEEQVQMIRENPAFGRIVCRCETVTEGDVVRAIQRPLGARTVDGVKFRTRAGMGRCQGGFCGPRVLEILSRELNMDPLLITKCGPGSEILTTRLRPEGDSCA